MRVARGCRLVESAGVSDSAARYWQGRLIEAMEAYSSARFQTAVGLSTEVEAVAQIEAALKEAALCIASIAEVHGVQLNAICTGTALPLGVGVLPMQTKRTLTDG